MNSTFLKKNADGLLLRQAANTANHRNNSSPVGLYPRTPNTEHSFVFMIAGIDIGSVTTKCVLIKDGKLAAKSAQRTGARPETSAEAVFTATLAAAGIRPEAIQATVSTGYGRRLVRNSAKVVTEISAAAAGAFASGGRRRMLVLDVGGQDTKIIEVSDSGGVTDFLMNDKCSAGTGRFLELMATVMETDFAGLSALALQAQAPVTINATCSVFAESEVVSLIAHAARREDIAAGIMRSIASRIGGMLHSFDRAIPLMFCGGGAISEALRQAVAAETGRELSVLPDPQFVVAYGAALCG